MWSETIASRVYELAFVPLSDVCFFFFFFFFFFSCHSTSLLVAPLP